MNELSNHQINGYFKNEPKFCGCFARNEPFPILKPKQGIIVNMDDKNKIGTHWVSLAANAGGNVLYYFDSFGIFPPISVLSYAVKHGYSKIKRNISQIQFLTSNMCGYYCIRILKSLFSGMKFIDALLSFPDLKPSIKNRKYIIDTVHI